MRYPERAAIGGDTLGIKKMTDQQIIDLFDRTNITLAELSAKSGRSVADLKKLLMGVN